MGFAAREFYVPFSKVDKEKRIVYGVAQAEIPDLQDDYVLYDASKDAFSNWQRNIREMHKPIAIGRAISVLCDPKKQEIMVGAQISKGAEDAWQKVLDGTYQGFSIGGYPTKCRSIIKNGKKLREISEYVLEELSLVDTPANPACLVRAITKRGKHLVATDVLGNLPLARTARDVLSNFHGVPKMAKRAKIAGLVTLNKSLKSDDEVLVARLEDFTKNADGSYTLIPDAKIAHFKKGDLDADGYDNASDGDADESGDAKDIDFEGMAKSAAGLHKGMCDAAGIDDHIAHYADSVGEDGDDQPGADDETTEKGVKPKKHGFTKGANKAFADILANTFAAFEKKFDDKIAALSPAAPRKGEEGTVIAKGAGEGAAAEPAAGSKEQLKKNLDSLIAERDTLLKSGTTPKTSAERAVRDKLARDIASAEVAYAAAAGLIAR